MRLRELELDEFRSYRTLRLTLDPAGFRAVGANASGKSTILEAIAMLATTRSPRTSTEREIANWESGQDLAVGPYARIRGEFVREDGAHVVEIGLSLDDRAQAPLKKRIRFDGQPVRAIDVVGQFKTVLFSPDDVNLISGPPGNRRRYLDMAISQASRTYLRALSRYGRVLEQRNSLLRAFSRDRAPAAAARPAEELAFWDSELTATAADVLSERIGAMNALSAYARAHFQRLTGDDSLEVIYLPSRYELPISAIDKNHWQAPSQQARQAISASFSSILAASRAEELRRGVTAVGPHRDDIAVYSSGIDLGRYGSRGEQRLAMISIKLAELDLLSGESGELPVLLLDDVLSELDLAHRSNVVSMLSSRSAQICVTATDESDLGHSSLAHLPMLRIANGAIERINGT